jgi:hypothetical protein
LFAALLALGCVDLTPPGAILVDGSTRDVRADASRIGPGSATDAESGDAELSDAEPSDAEPPAPDGSAAPDLEAEGDGPAGGAPDSAPAPAPDAAAPDIAPTDAPLLVNGSACGLGSQCQSGFCAQGRCCNEICSAPCFACDLAATPGTCTAIATGDPSRGACASEPPSGCGQDGTCDGAGGCRKHVSGTICLAASCSGGAQTAASTCNGAGFCQAGASSSCGSYQCDGAAGRCLTTCSLAEHCQTGFTCSGTTCLTMNPISGLLVRDTDAARAALWSVETNFQVGAAAKRPWADPQWAGTYVATLDPAASLLLGDQWVRVSAESKKYTGGPQATITLTRAADLYMIVDDRWGTTPSWTAGWTNTGFTASVFEGSSSRTFGFRIYRRSVAAGSFDLPPIGATTAYNYFIVAE